jgi:hypothetical protein
MAKDLAYLLVLIPLIAPLSLTSGLAFGLTALAIGRLPSVKARIPQQRWRFTHGRLVYGVAQMILGAMLASAVAHAWPALRPW